MPNIMLIPATIRSAPKAWPTPAAQRVALVKSRVAAHSAARSTRPPSRGNPGIRLKRPIMMLMGPSQSSTAANGPTLWNVRSGAAASKILGPARAAPPTSASAPMTRLVSGPTTVISSSARGERGSPRMWATPPKMNRVMPATGTPFARPTSACDSSCARIDSTNSTAAIAAMPQLSRGDQPGWRSGNRPLPRLATISQKTISKLQSRRTSTPKIRPTRKPRAPEIICVQSGDGSPSIQIGNLGGSSTARSAHPWARCRRRRDRPTARPAPSSRSDSAVPRAVVAAAMSQPA